MEESSSASTARGQLLEDYSTRIMDEFSSASNLVLDRMVGARPSVILFGALGGMKISGIADCIS